MARENFANFATSTLNGSITSGATSLTVTTGQGSLFPSSNFLVTIDAEILLITSRSGDTFTIGTRGYDGTTAASHSSAATVQLAACAYNFTHLWQNIPDAYTPGVPPIQIGGSASSYDNEFESWGSWSSYPSAAAGTTFDAGTSVRSHLTFDRGSSDSGKYYAYIAFSPSGAWIATCKLSMSTSLNHTSNAGDSVGISFFVSDQTNPTGGLDTGNRFRVDVNENVQLASSNSTTGTAYNQPYAYYAHCLYDSSGSGSFTGQTIVLSPGVPIFLRISCDGSGTYQGYVGDGVTYWKLNSKSGLTFTLQTLGIAYTSSTPSGVWMPQTALIDFVRVKVGTFNPNFAN